MTCGVYKIENLLDNKVYVGSSVKMENRKYRHFWMLENNKHDNHYLQNSYNKHGKECFIFFIIEECDDFLLIQKENQYIDFYRSTNPEFGFNLAIVNEFRRNTYNDEVKRKISNYNLTKNGNFSTFLLVNIKTKDEFVFNSLIDGSDYLIKNGFAKGKSRNVRMCISNCLRGIKLNNGYKGSIRKTCYKHEFKIIN